MNFNKFDFYKLSKFLDQIHDRIHQATYNANYRYVNCNNTFFEVYAYSVVDSNVPNTTNTIFQSMDEFTNEI